jgi:hypothetical protein
VLSAFDLKAFEDIMAIDPLDRFTTEYLRSQVGYNPETGEFRKNGKPAGFLNATGYRIIEVDGIKLRCGRLAVKLTFGITPPAQIDHINRVRNDDRLVNLRPASAVENARNRGNRDNNTSGVGGVTFNKAHQVWRARIDVNGKRKHLGSFEHFDDAVAARRQAEAELFGMFLPLAEAAD